MELEDHEIESFQRAWKNDFGEDISFEAARYELNRLLTFLDLLFDAFHGQDRPDGEQGSSCATMAA